MNDANLSLLPQAKTVIWDSGPVASADCTDIPYAGPPLASGGRYEWQVRACSLRVLRHGKKAIK